TPVLEDIGTATSYDHTYIHVLAELVRKGEFKQSHLTRNIEVFMKSPVASAKKPTVADKLVQSKQLSMPREESKLPVVLLNPIHLILMN
ncbi:hypothetical protein FRX31_029782, partial [Thalictrum thalictroides]